MSDMPRLNFSNDHEFYDLYLKGINFKPVSNQVIYYESSYNASINSFIKENYDKICDMFEKEGKLFCYFPQRADDIFSYYYPSMSEEARKAANNDLCNKIITPFVVGEKPTSPALLLPSFSFEKDGEQGCEYHCYQLNENISLINQFEYISKWEYDFDDYDTDVRYREAISEEYSEDDLRNFDFLKYDELDPKEEEEIKKALEDLKCHLHPEEYTADGCFGEYIEKEIVQDVRKKVKLLRVMGVDEAIIKSLVETDTKPSRMIITKDHKIILPDFNNMEIVMSPLQKAVYFLFLKHPEGIKFKNLRKYRQELYNIYSDLSNRNDLDEMQKSIDDIVDPRKNSINEKCTRVREAFISRFDEDTLAKYYIIDGERGEEKKIELDRNLVIWE